MERVSATIKNVIIYGYVFFIIFVTMMKKLLILVVSVLMAGAAVEGVSAQKVQLGVRAGIGSQHMKAKEALFDSDSRLGWNVAAVTRFRLIGFGRGILGAGLYLQPEIVYSQNNNKMKVRMMYDYTTRARVSEEMDAGKATLSTVEIPVLLSAKVSIVRVHAGPVFNVMTRLKQTDGDNMFDSFTTERPAVGYSIGAGVDLGLLNIDGRYYGDLGRMKLDGVRGSLSSWSLGVGVMF